MKLWGKETLQFLLRASRCASVAALIHTAHTDDATGGVVCSEGWSVRAEMPTTSASGGSESIVAQIRTLLTTLDHQLATQQRGGSRKDEAVPGDTVLVSQHAWEQMQSDLDKATAQRLDAESRADIFMKRAKVCYVVLCVSVCVCVRQIPFLCGACASSHVAALSPFNS